MTARQLMFSCLIAALGCDNGEPQAAMPASAQMALAGRAPMPAAGSPASGMTTMLKPAVAPECPKLASVLGGQLTSCCRSDGMCGLDASALNLGCAPYSSMAGLTPPAPTKCNPTSAVTMSSGTMTAQPPTQEASTQVYVEQWSRALADGGSELVYDFVLLFGDGWSTWRMAISALETPAADRAANPEAWAMWRRKADGRPERLLEGNQWTDVPGAEHKASAPGRMLNGTYSYTQFIMGNSLSRQMTFSANGQFEHASYVSSSGSSKQGTYRIDGYVLTLTLADGKTEQHTLVVSSGEEVIILDGTGYVR